jgi:hypothetical protein
MTTSVVLCIGGPLAPTEEQATRHRCWLCDAPVGADGVVDHYDGWLPPVQNRCAECLRAREAVRAARRVCSACGSHDHRRSYWLVVPQDEHHQAKQPVTRQVLCNRCRPRQWCTYDGDLLGMERIR